MRVSPSSIKVYSSKWTSLIAVNNSIYIYHWDNLKHKLLNFSSYNIARTCYRKYSASKEAPNKKSIIPSIKNDPVTSPGCCLPINTIPALLSGRFDSEVIVTCLHSLLAIVLQRSFYLTTLWLEVNEILNYLDSSFLELIA
jgi:hypothetical protein